jgi:hypothetical protein
MTLLFEHGMMQVNHEVDYKYNATNCINKIEGWCF